MRVVQISPFRTEVSVVAERSWEGGRGVAGTAKRARPPFQGSATAPTHLHTLCEKGLHYEFKLIIWD